jgi:protein phosphatase 1G
MGSLLPKPVTEKDSETGGCDTVQWSATAMQGWRMEMEDAHIAIADVAEEFSGVGLYCVFDGHGGKAVSSFCKLRFADELRQLTQDVGKAKFGKNKAKKRHCGSKLEASDFEDILKNSFHRMDDLLREPANAKQLSRLVGKVPGGAIEDLKKQINVAQGRYTRGELSREEQEDMKEKVTRLQKFEQAEKGEDFVADNVGCTAICVLVRENDIVAANAGDSRAVLCRSSKAVELSFDHKPASEIEKSRIEAAGGYLEDTPGGARVNGNLNLSRAIGDLEYKKRDDLPPEQQIICSTPDVIVKERQPEDEFIILACDGIWDVMTNQAACDFVRERLLEKKDVAQVGIELLDKCITPDPQQTQGLGTDNMTAVIVKFTGAPAWA